MIRMAAFIRSPYFYHTKSVTFQTQIVTINRGDVRVLLLGEEKPMKGLFKGVIIRNK